MCGRRKMETERPDLCNWGDMTMVMLTGIAAQVPSGVFVQFHWNGEPLLYPEIGEAIAAFSHCYTGLDTNGKLLLERFDQLQALDTITISVIPNDPEGFEQSIIFIEYMERKPSPLVILRVLGEDENSDEWAEAMQDRFNKIIIANRVLHAPEGSFNYEKPVTIPEIGCCLEILHKLAIDRYGNISPCVRYDPEGLNRLGNVSDRSLKDIWYGAQREEWINHHLQGRRDKVPLCKSCDFWGVPRG